MSGPIYHPELTYTHTEVAGVLGDGHWTDEKDENGNLLQPMDPIDRAVERATNYLCGKMGRLVRIVNIAMVPLQTDRITFVAVTVTVSPLSSADERRVWQRVEKVRKS